MATHRFELHWLLPAAAATSAALVAAPAAATTYFTLEQAQQQLCPERELVPVTITLNNAQKDKIEQSSGVHVLQSELHLWQAADGSCWFYVDRVLGKHEYITYALALDAYGAVTGLEILEYRETYGDAVRNPQWRGQFTGKHFGAAVKLDVDIVNMSGATLSSAHITNGVRRLLATHALVVTNKQ